MLEPYGTSVFCDTIRQEVTGKAIYVGVYNDNIIFNGKPPVVWPSIAVAISIIVPIDFEFKNLRVAVKQQFADSEEQVLFNQEITTPEDVPKEFVHPDKRMKINVIAEVNNMNFISDGVLLVRAYFDDLEVKLGTLQIAFDVGQPKP